MSKAQELREQILSITNGGLEIIMRYYPQARERQNFRIRPEDKTASASLKRMPDGNYIVTDWGDDSVKRNAIAVAAKETGQTLYEATMMLANEYQLIQTTAVLRPEIKQPSVTEIDYEFEYPASEGGADHYFNFETEWNDNWLKILGPCVTEDICKKYKLFPVNFYATKKDGVIKEFYSTEHYPILAFVNEHETGDKKGQKWIKLYFPKSQDKKYRFRYINGKPKDFVFGLKEVKEKFNSIQEAPQTDEDGKESEPKIKKLERIVICSGDRDSLNMASFGEFVVWMNSETEGIDRKFFARLAEMATDVINVPDLDPTGRRQGLEAALNNIDLKTAWLPADVTSKVDFRGKYRKDFTDFCSQYAYNPAVLKRKVNLLLENALTVRFWTKSISQKGAISYTPSPTNIYYFLKCNGFYRIADENNDKGFIYVRIQDHLVTEVHPNEIKDFIQNYLIEKREELGDRWIPKELLNKFYQPQALSEAIFTSVPKTTFIPTRSTDKVEYFHFKNQIWEISKEGTKLLDIKSMTTHVWDYKVLEQRVKRLYNKDLDSSKIFIDEPYFNITRKDDVWNVDILKKDCEFLNYMINLSRVQWEAEFDGLSDSARAKYLEENRFAIKSDRLPEEFNEIQQHHLVNKIFALGYLLHRYKLESRPWVVVIMDNEVVLDDTSCGGTGKSIFTKAPRVFLESKEIEANVPNLFDDRFLYDGVTPQTDYIYFDDADKKFQFRPLYAKTTGDFTVNPKNKTPFVIPFADAPKFAVSTNFVINDNSPSTIRRTVEVTASNWYHAEDANGQNGHTPEDDFGHMLFSGWGIDQWNFFFNLCAQSIQFYLSQSEKITAPTGNVKKRKLLAEMGSSFKDWADEYLEPYVYTEISLSNALIEKSVLMNNLKENVKALSGITSNLFTKKLNAWCQYNDVTLNPEGIPGRGSDGRITKKDKSVNKTIEYYYFYKPTDTEEEVPSTDYVEPSAGDWMKDDMDDFPI